ncbi:hypothetical protein Tco_0546810 [Tanacetum coccineum]
MTISLTNMNVNKLLISVHGFKEFSSDEQAMTSDHNSSELEIHDHNNEPSSSKLVPKVIPSADKTTTSRQELELLFYHHITMLRMVVKEIVCRLLEEEERSWNGGLSKTLIKNKRDLKEMKMVVKYGSWVIK